MATTARRDAALHFPKFLRPVQGFRRPTGCCGAAYKRQGGLPVELTVQCMQQRNTCERDTHTVVDRRHPQLQQAAGPPSLKIPSPCMEPVFTVAHGYETPVMAPAPAPQHGPGQMEGQGQARPCVRHRHLLPRRRVRVLLRQAPAAAARPGRHRG
jgi:hypothetical protein